MQASGCSSQSGKEEKEEKGKGSGSRVTEVEVGVDLKEESLKLVSSQLSLALKTRKMDPSSNMALKRDDEAS